MCLNLFHPSEVKAALILMLKLKNIFLFTFSFLFGAMSIVVFVSQVCNMSFVGRFSDS